MRKNLSYIQNEIAKHLDEVYDEFEIPEDKRTLATIFDEKQKNYDVDYINEEGNILEMSSRIFFHNETKEEFDKNLIRQLRNVISMLIK